jgi:peptidoglycan/xylan/chitin deacetylase (PgdA/CDA1 family)
MYHRLAERPPDAEEGDYVIPAGIFARQMDVLAAEGRAVVLPAPHGGFAAAPGSVMLTFDDGCASDFEEALPILRARRFRAAFFVNPARIGRPGYLGWDELQALANADMVVGSHGLDHALLDDLPEPELERQLAASRDLLESRLGRPVEWLSLPGGTGGRRALRIASARGYRLVFGSRPGLVDPLRPPPVLPRWAVRQGHGLEGFRDIVSQRPGPRIRAELRFALTHFARAAVGGARYARWRRLWLGDGRGTGRGR